MEIKIDTVNDSVAYLNIIGDSGTILVNACIDHTDTKAFQEKLEAQIIKAETLQNSLSAAKTKVETIIVAKNMELSAAKAVPIIEEEKIT
jgi:hypothetical protein